MDPSSLTEHGRRQSLLYRETDKQTETQTTTDKHTQTHMDTQTYKQAELHNWTAASTRQTDKLSFRTIAINR